MSTASKKKKALEKWEKHCLNIQRKTQFDSASGRGEKIKRIERAKGDYKYFFEHYFPHYAKSECAGFHVKIAEAIKTDRQIEAVLEMYRGSAKTTHSIVGIPLWLLINDELGGGMVVVGDTGDKAKKLLGSLQAEFQFNPAFREDFGDYVSHGDWTDGDFTIRDGSGFYALGLGSSPRGVKSREKRPSLIVVDDADTKKRCKNPKLVSQAVEWILEDLRGCFDSEDDGFERLIIANNRIHKASILAKLAGTRKKKKLGEGERAPADVFYEGGELVEPYHVVVNALDEKGNPKWPQKTSRQYWEKKRKKWGYRGFQREYMNNPIHDGKIFKEKHMPWKQALPLSEYDAIVGYGDLSFSKLGDFKAFPILAKKGREYMVLKAFCRQCKRSDVPAWVFDYEEGTPDNIHISYWFEGSFAQGDIFMEDFDLEAENRGWDINIRADLRSKGNKFDRIEGMSSTFEQNRFYFNSEEADDPDMIDLRDQFLAFEEGGGAPDDGPDAIEGAKFILDKFRKARRFPPRLGKRERKLRW